MADWQTPVSIPSRMESAEFAANETSYAQNFEDLLLARLFRLQASGFYVDVGAGDPVRFSVTKIFYDRGWRGINIEPHPGSFRSLQSQRPRDINLDVAVGSRVGHATFYESLNPDLSSFDRKYAEGAEASPLSVTERRVRVRPLSEILSEHVPGVEIDFLKIDVEGAERDVIQGTDLAKFRPRVLVIESTLPSTRVPAWDAWEGMVLEAGYLFAQFDGLNRFYVRNEDRDLVEQLKLPINLFDGIDPYDLFRAYARNQSLDDGTSAAQRELLAQVNQVLQRGVSVVSLLEQGLSRIEAAIARRDEQTRAALMRVEAAVARLEERAKVKPVKLKTFQPRLGIYYQHPPRRWQAPVHYTATGDAKAVEAATLPRFSVVTAVLNQGKFVGETIKSVLAQEYKNIEYFIEDGGSTDGSVEEIRLYEDKLSNFCSARDSGQANAINRGFARSTGDIMAWINADDLFMPGCFHYVARFFMANPDVDIVYGHRVIIDHRGWEIGRWILPAHDAKVLKYCDWVPQETMFWRRRVWDKVGPLDESFQFALDWDFLLRAQEAGFTFKRLPRFLGCFRCHEEQKSSALLQTVGIPEMNRLRLRTFGRPIGDREIRKKIRSYLRRHVLLHRAYKLRLVEY